MSEDQDIRGRAEQRIGSVLHGKYRLDAILGVGGMAVVYAATHRNQKKVAVKVLHPELSLRREVRTRFLREGYAANAVEHDGVVSVLDDDVDEHGSAFLVMELLQGLDVQTWSARSSGMLPVPVALLVTRQLLDVLAAAHSKGVIHRDIKPANLFMQRSGRLKVLDFGIARVRVRALGSEATRTGAVLGTPAFMAPELASAQRDEIDARTDLWAVGATLFSLLSGEHVHPGEHANQVLIRAATAEARSVLSVAPDLPAPVAALLARALAFEKGARFQAAAEMAAALDRVHGQLFGQPASHLIQRHLAAAAAALSEPATASALVPFAVAAGAGSTVSEAEVSHGLAAAVPSQAHSPSVEPVFLPSPSRARPRRAVSLLGVAAALLAVGVAFDGYVSRSPAPSRSANQTTLQSPPKPAPRAAVVSLQAALPAPAPLGTASAFVAAPPPPSPPSIRRATVRRVSAAASDTPPPSPRSSKNPLDVELQ